MCLSTRSRVAPSLRLRARAAPAALTPALFAVAAGWAVAEPCKLARVAELPVTMEGLRPLVHGAINGKDALFIADSGAFFSMLTPAAAREFNLPLDPAPLGFRLLGIGGDAQVWRTTVQKFTIFGVDVTRVPFLVAGNDLGHGAIGVLGQNVFRLGDVEYDLANGVISLMRTHGDCAKVSLAYWANSKGLPYSAIDIDFATFERPHTTGEAYVNGRKIRVLFDSGAATSVLTLDAAKRAGITPESPGVTAAGSWGGVGRYTVPSWIAPFASFKIGDEEVRNTHLRVGEVGLPQTDMLIGADFFLSHHVLVASSQRKLYFTYNGGPVFDLSTMRTLPPGSAEPATAGDTPPPPPAAAAAAGQPVQPEQPDAAGYARRGSASASRRDYGPALADLTRAIELAPTEAEYRYERGLAYRANGQSVEALEDFSQAIRLKADHVPALLARAELRAGRGDPAELISPDLEAIDRAAPREGEMRLALGDLYQHIGNYPAAIAQYDEWVDSHNRDEVHMSRARGARCRARALSGGDLDRALDDCNFGVRRSPKAAAFLDSRGLVYFRQGRYDKAIADYDAALAINPKIAWSLYGRGLARRRLGQSAAGETDVAAAKALAPNIAEEAASHGVVP